MMGKTVQICREVLRDILAQVGSRAPETGGMIGMQEDVVTRFWFDAGGVSMPGAYLPDVEGCEAVLNGVWQDEGVVLCGFVHSHRDSPCPSVPDRRYMQELCRALGRKEMLLCICHAGRLRAWWMRPCGEGICCAEEVHIVCS